MQPYTRQTAYCGRNGDYAIDEKRSTLAYSHGFTLWKKECKFVKTSLLSCVPKCPGSEVREEYKRGCTIAVHPENDPKEEGFEQAKAYAVATEDIKEF
jgi:ketol-acid reductoisomerase